jgi:hypothetical protein
VWSARKRNRVVSGGSNLPSLEHLFRVLFGSGVYYQRSIVGSISGNVCVGVLHVRANREHGTDNVEDGGLAGSSA